MTAIIASFFSIFVFIAFFALVLKVIKSLVNSSNKVNKVVEEYLPYVKKEYFMTKTEHEFFKVLQVAVEDKYYIIPQVQLSNLVQLEWQIRGDYAPRNKINRKSVDFVLFNKEFFTPYLVIELDDSSHLRHDRQERDNFVDSILNKVGIKFVHIKTGYNHDLKQLSDYI